MSQEELKNVLIENLKKSDFVEISKYLFLNTHIKVANKSFRLAEIEFYVCNDNHKDIFTHCNNQQKEMLTWYFHQMSNKAHSYKGGTFKGLDITCGSENGYGGILIRSILDETSNTIIEGPCKVVNEILGCLKIDSIKLFVTEKLKNNLSCFDNDFLTIEFKKYSGIDLYVAPRIGLYLKGNDIDEKKKFIVKDYRYIFYKNGVKKEKKKMKLLTEKS